MMDQGIASDQRRHPILPRRRNQSAFPDCSPSIAYTSAN